MSIKLSGEIRYRALTRLWRKPLLVLQVREVGTQPEFLGGHIDMCDVSRWRDATMEDLSMLQGNKHVI